MPMLQLILLALVQGITEFLPISSSGHLILLPNLTGMADQGQAIDVAVHVGTLAAVVLYFWRDVKVAALGTLALLRRDYAAPGARLALGLAIATVPVVIFGLILKLTGLDEALRSVAVIGWTMLGFGIVLYWADQKGPEIRNEEDWGPLDALKMGLWQAVALIPGTSRSGITITGARAMGYNRHDAAKISMLMSIPTIFASGVLLGAEVIADADMQLARDAAIGAVFAFAAALAALSLMMRLLRSVSFTPYVIYRIVLGVGLLWYAYS
ncbi:undecaprenyl-diphosphate phosphatase [Salipiger sp. P9]|uniref:undecaprenyl-diphosphate phosphatase n=1 Tax=Salipiger pentaromativorans TaxID=2943193 RepID=UPI0021585C1B|nr:undecaprenyl-diphosphate phosphatase [Salipiger pentaromativorans]MCR8549441.1 undecaprenyl-diphosphate phosphatase [Salipiger pentaromativorans]